MAEKLFGFGFGYLIRLLRGDLSPALLLAAGAMLLLAAAVEVWEAALPSLDTGGTGQPSAA